MNITQLPNNSINEIVEPKKNEFHLYWWNKGLNDDEMYIKYELYFDRSQIDIGTSRNIDLTLTAIEKQIDEGYYNMDILYQQLEILQSGITDLLNNKSFDDIKQFSDLSDDRINELKSYCYTD